MFQRILKRLWVAWKTEHPKRVSDTVFLLVAGWVGAFGGVAWALDATTPRFLFSTFRNADKTKLYIATSFDGRRFDILGGSHVYTAPAPEQIRDPSLIRLEDAWYVCHTAGTKLGNAPYFSVLRSVDLVNWVKVADVSTASVPNTNYTWAPEWFRDEDGSVHVIVGMSPWQSREFVMYEMHPTQTAMTEWSVPQRLTGAAFPEFAHQPDPLQPQWVGDYDAHIIKRGGEYHITYFDVETSYIHAAKAPTLLGPYTPYKTGDWLGIGNAKEGGTMVSLEGANWRFYYANAITSTMYYVESADDWATWTPPALLNSDLVFNHGTVIFNPDLPGFRTSIEPLLSGRMRLRFPGVNKNGYRLETSPDLLVWTPEGGVIQGAGGEAVVEHEPGGAGRWFYRVLWLPFHVPVE